MGRPRSLKLDDKREILLYNMTAEDAERVKALFVAGEAPAAPAPTTEPPGEYTHTAPSSYQDKEGYWHFVTLGYDPVTQEARVLTDKKTEKTKIYVIEEFKKYAVNSGLV